MNAPQRTYNDLTGRNLWFHVCQEFYNRQNKSVSTRKRWQKAKNRELTIIQLQENYSRSTPTTKSLPIQI